MTSHDSIPPSDEALRWQLRALHQDMPPTRDLWPGIAARLAGPRELAPAGAPPETAPGPRIALYQRRWSVGLPELALAATLLAALGGTLLWPRAVPAPPAAGTAAPIIAEAEAVDGGDG